MNTYLSRICQLSRKEKYLTWYCNIITNASHRAKTRKQAKEKLTYVEAHHILPKCMSNDNEKVDSNNLVYLTSREHIIVHWLMIKMFKGTCYYKKALSMLGAFMRVTKTQLPRKACYIYKTSLIGECISKANKGRKSQYKGKPLSPQTRLKMSAAKKGKKPANYDLFIRHASGKIYVNNGEQELRVFPSNIPHGFVEGPLRKKCPHCGYTADVRNFQKYHKKCVYISQSN